MLPSLRVKTDSFGPFVKKVWGWHLLIDMILVTVATWFAYRFLTDKHWDTAIRVNQFQGILALQGIHSVCLFIYSLTKFWRKEWIRGALLFLHALLLLILAGLLTGAALMAGMR